MDLTTTNTTTTTTVHHPPRPPRFGGLANASVPRPGLCRHKSTTDPLISLAAASPLRRRRRMHTRGGCPTQPPTLRCRGSWTLSRFSRGVLSSLVGVPASPPTPRSCRLSSSTPTSRPSPRPARPPCTSPPPRGSPISSGPATTHPPKLPASTSSPGLSCSPSCPSPPHSSRRGLAGDIPCPRLPPTTPPPLPSLAACGGSRRRPPPRARSGASPRPCLARSPSRWSPAAGP